MFVLINSIGVVVESSDSTILPDPDADCFISASHRHYDPRPSSGITVVEMDFPEESASEYQIQDGAPVRVVPASAEKQMAARAAFTAARAVAVAAIRVAVGEHEFDGDEKSQGRMARAILAMQAAGVESTPWALADNTVAMVSLLDMQKALIAAGLAQTALWMPE